MRFPHEGGLLKENSGEREGLPGPSSDLRQQQEEQAPRPPVLCYNGAFCPKE